MFTLGNLHKLHIYSEAQNLTYNIEVHEAQLLKLDTVFLYSPK
jgi:hypothetical protein